MPLLQHPLTSVTYFTDCVADETDKGDAHARMAVAVGREMGLSTVTFVDVSYPGDGFDVAMTLVGVVAANQPTSLRRSKGYTVVLNNSAPRRETQGSESNGRKVCAVVAEGNTLIVSTFSGGFFELAHRLGLVQSVMMFETEEVLGWAAKESLLTEAEAESMADDQFRGARYIPWLAGLLIEQLTAGVVELPHEWFDLGERPKPRGLVARLDSQKFGPNVYLDVLADELAVDWGSGYGRLQLRTGQLIRCYGRLADIPPGQLGAVPSSSGFGPRRFVMLAIQGGSGAQELARLLGEPMAVGVPVLTRIG